MKIHSDSQGHDARIEIIPLIDVIFCILTFFILAAVGLTRQQAIGVDLPKASTGAPQMREMLLVSLNPYGQVYVEQELMATPEQLGEKLKQYHLIKPDGLMVLYASKTASYNDVVQVLDQMRLVGGDRVALGTLPDETNPTSTNGSQTPPASGVPGVPPYAGTNPVNPYNPYNPYGTSNPGYPSYPGQVPGASGVYPGVPGSSTLTPSLPNPTGVPTSPATGATPSSNSGSR